MKRLLVLLSVCFFLVCASGTRASDMCPSKTTYIKIVAFDKNNKPTQVSALFIAPGFLPGTDSDCPNSDIMAEMLEIDHATNTYERMPIFLPKGVVSNPANILTREEAEKLQGIPPKQEKKPEQKSKPTPEPKGRTTANAETKSLHSSIY